MAKFSKAGVWDKVPEESTQISEISKFPYNTVLDMWNEASIPNTSLVV